MYLYRLLRTRRCQTVKQTLNRILFNTRVKHMSAFNINT